ncbi:MAG TPA: hypothetical protein VIV11_28120 [Kofleriaceae bacterium]
MQGQRALIFAVLAACGDSKTTPGDASTDAATDDAAAIDATPIDAVPIDAATDAPVDAALPPHPRRVFLTSVYGLGNLTAWPDSAGYVGLPAADAICQARAIAASLDGVFVAWLSTSTNDAYCRVQGFNGTTRANNCGQPTLPSMAGPWVRVDGVPWAASLAELTGANPRVYSPQLLNEFGQPTTDHFFSNTSATGTATTQSCNNWSASTGGVGYGGARMSGTYWTQWGTWGCYLSSPLMCMEVGSGPAHVFPAITGKRAFVTSTVTTGNLATSPEANGQTGVAAGDAICQARAAAASLPNATQFKAWLSTAAADAATRITSNGPWQRVDGLPLASSKLDLLDGMLLRSLDVTESGAYLSGATVWTASWRDGTTLGAACGDWTGSTATAYVGRANDPKKWSYAEYVSTCTTTTARLYCFED